MAMTLAHRPRTLVAVAAALAVAACSGTPDAMKRSASQRPGASPSSRPQATLTPSFTSAAARQCAADLQQAGVKFTQLPNADHGGGCTSIDSVKLLALGTPVPNLGPMTCPLARTFAAWVESPVHPAA